MLSSHDPTVRQHIELLYEHHAALMNEQGASGLYSHFTVTRSHKWTDRDHAGIADGTAEREAKLPRYFAKSGHADTDPTKTKKDGSGKGNWYV